MKQILSELLEKPLFHHNLTKNHVVFFIILKFANAVY